MNPQVQIPPQIPRASCGVLIRRADGAVLLAQRRRQPEPGHWGIPGGKVDWLERVETAARREIAEETGITLGGMTLLCVADHFEPDLGQHWVATIYSAHTDAEPRLMEPEAMAAIGWFAPDALPSPLTRTARAALKAAGMPEPR